MQQVDVQPLTDLLDDLSKPVQHPQQVGQQQEQEPGLAANLQSVDAAGESTALEGDSSQQPGGLLALKAHWTNFSLEVPL